MFHSTFHELLTQVRVGFDHDRPGFSLFLGAGASRSSGVPLAEELADFAFEELFRDDGNIVDSKEPPTTTKQRVRDWVKLQRWYDKDHARYSLAMEHALLAPGVRAAFLRKQMQAARPSPGYGRLAQLLESRVFDTIYTTNFDDLVFRASAAVLTESLVQVASLAQYSRQNPSPQKPPRLLRLHGDYYHGDILNTEGELEETPTVRFETVHRLSCPQGIIVIGYGGRDRRIMADLFEHFLKADRNFLENGLFWCIQRGSELPQRVQDLRMAGGDRVHVIEIDGFDEAMEGLASGFKLRVDRSLLTESLRSSVDVQALMADAAELLTDRTNNLGALACGIEGAFLELCGQVGAREAALIAVVSEEAEVVCAVNVPLIANVRLPAALIRSLPGTQGVDISTSELARLPSLSSAMAGARTVAYPVSCDTERLGLALFSFPPSLPASDKDERIIAAISGLLVLASRRFLNNKQLRLTQLAESFWGVRGCPSGSPGEDWARAEGVVRGEIDALRRRC